MVTRKLILDGKLSIEILQTRYNHGRILRLSVAVNGKVSSIAALRAWAGPAEDLPRCNNITGTDHCFSEPSVDAAPTAIMIDSHQSALQKVLVNPGHPPGCYGDYR